MCNPFLLCVENDLILIFDTCNFGWYSKGCFVPHQCFREFSGQTKILAVLYATRSSVFLWEWELNRLKPIFLTFLVFKNISYNNTIIWKRITFVHLLCSAVMTNAERDYPLNDKVHVVLFSYLMWHSVFSYILPNNILKSNFSFILLCIEC